MSTVHEPLLRRPAAPALLVALALTLAVLAPAHAQNPWAQDIPGPQIDRTIELDMDGPGLQFSIVRFDVHVGQAVKLNVRNSDDMVHNFLIVRGQPNRDELQVAEAVIGMPNIQGRDYIPDDERIVLASSLLRPGDAQAITFYAPDRPGEYPFVCTIPGHAQTMRGIMRVRDRGQSLRDPIPATMDADFAANDQVELQVHHEPRVIRGTFPGVSTRSIAVGMPGGTHYVFDTEKATVPYAWHGEFLDLSNARQGRSREADRVTDGHGNPMGQHYLFGMDEQPLRIGDPGNIPEIRFRGYRNPPGQMPQMHYELDGHELRQTVIPAGEPGALTFVYVFPTPPGQDLYVVLDPEGYEVTASIGQWREGVLYIPAAHVASFALTLTPGVSEIGDKQVFLDAAHATRSATVSLDSDHTGYRGWGFANYQQDDATGSSLQWHINVAESGSYRLGIRYALSGDTRELTLRVEDGASQQVSFDSTGAWDAWDTLWLSVDLDAGPQTISLDQHAGRGPNIDGIDLNKEQN